MTHYSCDMCGKDVTNADDHFILVAHISPAEDYSALTEEDLDEDHLAQLGEALKQLEAQGKECLDQTRPVHVRLDLCGLCRHELLTNPIGRSSLLKLNFSEN